MLLQVAKHFCPHAVLLIEKAIRTRSIPIDESEHDVVKLTTKLKL
jgi:hypothetical protein